MNRHERRKQKALGIAVPELEEAVSGLTPEDLAAARTKDLVLSGTPPEDVPPPELALVLGIAGQVVILAAKLGVGTDKLSVHFDMPSGKHVCFSFGEAPEAVHVH
jgi:hypothetical protein